MIAHIRRCAARASDGRSNTRFSPVQASSSTQSTLQRAGLWPRFAALVYESILLIGIVFIASWLYLHLFGNSTEGLKRHAFQLMLITVCGIYFVYCWQSSGQTLAMKTWGLRIVRRDGTRVSFGLAVLRYLLALASAAIAGLGFLWAIVDRDRQYLHDRLLGTQIIKAPI